MSLLVDRSIITHGETANTIMIVTTPDGIQVQSNGRWTAVSDLIGERLVLLCMYHEATAGNGTAAPQRGTISPPENERKLRERTLQVV